MTPFSTVIDYFLRKITDDMYMEMTKADTEAHAADYIPLAIPYFEFPRTALWSFDAENSTFNDALTNDEINIIATYMVVCWIDQQLASIELTRMKYSGTDWKMTSQASHMNRLKDLKANFIEQGFHLQRVYKRRRVDNGVLTSTISDLRMGRSYE